MLSLPLPMLWCCLFRFDAVFFLPIFSLAATIIYVANTRIPREIRADAATPYAIIFFLLADAFAINVTTTTPYAAAAIAIFAIFRFSLSLFFFMIDADTLSLIDVSFSSPRHAISHAFGRWCHAVRIRHMPGRLMPFSIRHDDFAFFRSCRW